MFKNQKKVDQISAELHEVAPGAKIQNWRLDHDNSVIEVTARIMVKGNSLVIKTLEQMGWEKLRCEKVTSADFWGRCQYEGHSFVQIMRKWIN